MTLDTRARRAAQGIRNAVEVMEMSTSTKEPRKVERFDRFRDRKQRNRRIGAFLVAALLTIATIVVARSRSTAETKRFPRRPLRTAGSCSADGIQRSKTKCSSRSIRMGATCTR